MEVTELVVSFSTGPNNIVGVLLASLKTTGKGAEAGLSLSFGGTNQSISEDHVGRCINVFILVRNH